jgi:glutamine cyclotransferase
MKKYIILGVLILAIIAMIVGPMINERGGTYPPEEEAPALFTFKDNLATRWNEIVPLTIKVQGKDIQKLELIYNDSVFNTWTNPVGTLNYRFNAGFFGLGTRDLVLLSTLKDGTTYMDNRMVRVLSDVRPEIWIAEISEEYPHEPTSFTQGLEFNAGILYESTGQKGLSFVAQVDVTTGSIKKKMGLDANYFGEGITVLGSKLYQLTWQEQKCFVYNKNTLQLEKELTYNGEGWGLCNDGESLVMSDGTERLVFRDPETFQVQRTVEVYDDRGPVSKLNELEYVNGMIYANVWMTNTVVVIQPENGKVTAVIDGTELVKRGRGTGDVLNGIAYNSAKEKLYMTGKNWPKLFEVRLKKPNV